MAEPLSFDDDVGFKKTPRYKGSTQRNDIIRIIPIAGEEGQVKSLFFKHTIYVGKRQDGQMFIIHKHPDPAQNIAAQMGYEEQTSGCCLVLHLAQSPPRVQNYAWTLQALVWTFGNDKWQRLKEIGRSMPLEKQELAIVCTEEMYQKLTISVIHPDQQISKRLNDGQLAAVRDQLLEGVASFRDFLKPHNRTEQEKIIAGRGASQAAGAGFQPFVGAMPSGGFPIGPGGSQALTVPPRGTPAPASAPAAPKGPQNDDLLSEITGDGAAPAPTARPEIQVADTIKVDLGATPSTDSAPVDTDEVSKIVTDLLDKSSG